MTEQFKYQQIDTQEQPLEVVPTPITDGLPIHAFQKEIKEGIQQNPTLIVVGETGSGKTTQIPLMLHDLLGEDEKVIVTQPRRVAVRSVSNYVARQLGCRVGEDVGYKVRFDDHTTEGTQINFMTDGILLRMLQEDPLLSGYSAVMVDEVHERSLNIDFSMGLLKQTQQLRREQGLPELKLVLSSATMEKEKLSQYFDDAPIVEVPGRMFPVEIKYETMQPYDYLTTAVERTKDALHQDAGDVLIFMPGTREIEQICTNLQDVVADGDLEVLPLHSQLSPEEQDQIFAKNGKRKVIVATNIAETSITVPGVTTVIDSGKVRQMEFDPSSGISALVDRDHAKSGCVQRAGRAGRVQPGTCYRLFTQENFDHRNEYQVPEIQRSNLANVVLQMKKIGIADVSSFDFIDRPSQKALNSALQSLQKLGALDIQGELTEIGTKMAELPLEPHISRMLIESQKFHCSERVATIAAFLGARNIFNRPRGREYEADSAHGSFRYEGSDFITLLNVWEQYSALKTWEQNEWAFSKFLNGKALREVVDVRSQLLAIMRRNRFDMTETGTTVDVERSIASGLVENLMERMGRGSYIRIGDNRQYVYVHPGSVLFYQNPQFMVSSEIVDTSKVYARKNQAVRPEWLIDIVPHLITVKESEPKYNSFSEQVIIRRGSYLSGRYSPFMQEDIKLDLTFEEKARYIAEDALGHYWLMDETQANIHLVQNILGVEFDAARSMVRDFYIKALLDTGEVDANAIDTLKRLRLRMTESDVLRQREIAEVRETTERVLFEATDTAVLPEQSAVVDQTINDVTIETEKIKTEEISPEQSIHLQITSLLEQTNSGLSDQQIELFNEMISEAKNMQVTDPTEAQENMEIILGLIAEAMKIEAIKMELQNMIAE